jgi:hypothetical protein
MVSRACAADGTNYAVVQQRDIHKSHEFFAPAGRAEGRRERTNTPGTRMAGFPVFGEETRLLAGLHLSYAQSVRSITLWADSWDCQSNSRAIV